MKVSIHIVKGPNKGQVYDFLYATTILIGRSSKADVSLNQLDPYISRRHCVLEVDTPICILKNLSQSNPTLLNGQSIEQQELKDKDKVQIGVSVLEIHLSSLNSSKNHFVCGHCGKDLNAFANSDGQANQLLGKVTYICSDCLPKSKDYQPGEMKGKYELVRFISKGGMGKVYLVYHRETARLLALKEIIGLKKGKSTQAHFLREIKVHQHLSHPHIIHYLDEGMESGRPFFVMEYANHGSLEQYLKEKDGKIPLEETIQYMLQSLRALSYFHNLTPPIVHRDIKPENILLHKVEDELIAKISDFGLAKPYQEAGGQSLTRTGEYKGTLRSMSPEQIKSAKNADHRTDIYAIGITFYYLLTTKLPFHYPSSFEEFILFKKYALTPQILRQKQREIGFGNNPFEVILRSSFIPIEQQNPVLPKPLCKIINQCIAKNAAERYQQTSRLLKELEEFYQKWKQEQISTRKK